MNQFVGGVLRVNLYMRPLRYMLRCHIEERIFRIIICNLIIFVGVCLDASDDLVFGNFRVNSNSQSF